MILLAMLNSALCSCSSAGISNNVTPATNIAADSASSKNVIAKVNNGAVTPAVTSHIPLAADAFVDSIGINTHLTFLDQVYYTNFSAIENLLVSSGIRHLRDGAYNTGPWYAQRLNQLAAAGIKGDFIIPDGTANSFLQTFANAVAPSIESYEGPNELDDSLSNFTATLQTTMPQIYNAIKSNAGTAQLPVLAPSFGSYNSYTMLGNISQFVTEGNLHNYYGGYNPGTSGWGAAGLGGNYGSLSFAVAHAQLVSGSEPIITTETGYCDGGPPNASPAPQAAATRYMPRLFLEQFLAGIARTYVFEFADEPSHAPFASCGIVTAQATPKPQYMAIKNLIALLSDKGERFTVKPFNYALSGGGTALRQALLQKRDGSNYLILWQEVLSANPGATTALTIAPQTVNIDFGTTRSIQRYVLNDQGNMPLQTTTSQATSLSFGVDDHITVLKLH